jgi:hypothetical protein
MSAEWEGNYPRPRSSAIPQIPSKWVAKPVELLAEAPQLEANAEKRELQEKAAR